jgi:imidazole glycerol phosphate synthase subunit HisF
MKEARIIPCLDVKDGRVVKGINFVNLRDARDPVEAAEAYCGEGADELVFLDIFATVEDRKTRLEWAKRVEELGAGEILLTSKDADGTKEGYDLEMTKAVAEAVAIPVIASGGAGKLEHLYDAIKVGKAAAVLAASIFHFGEISIAEAKRYLKERGIPLKT